MDLSYDTNVRWRKFCTFLYNQYIYYCVYEFFINNEDSHNLPGTFFETVEKNTVSQEREEFFPFKYSNKVHHRGMFFYKWGCFLN